MRLSIATKIFIAFTAVIVIFTAVLMFGIYRTQSTYDQIQAVNRSVVPLSLILSDVQTDLKSFSLVLNERDPLVLRRTLQVTRLAPSMPDRFRHKMDRAASIAEETPTDGLSAGAGGLAPLDTRARVAALRDEIQGFATQSREFTALVLGDAASEPGGAEAIAGRQEELREAARRLDERLTTLRNDLRAAIDQSLARAKELERSSLYALSVSSVAALAIAIVLLIAVLWTIRPLTALTEAARRIGQGDYRPIERLPERRVAQDEIALLTREFNSMAHSLAERDQALREQHAKLLKSERLATVGRMTSLITHELRNPLSSINLNSEMLLDSLTERGITDEEILPTLETIINEVDRLRDITEEYLVYARLPSPRLEPDSLTDVLQSLVDFHVWEWSQQEVAVELDVPDFPLPVRIDSNQMRQALLNLLKNAIEASPRGATVLVRAARVEDEIHVTVQDQGPGIPDEVLERIYDPFYTTKQSGTGLGLAMTQQIVEEHGGHLTVETGARGTTFTLILPAA